MRVLTPTLEAAQKATRRVPYVRCVVDDEPPALPRFSWADVYVGAEQSNYHDSCVLLDGSIFTVRVYAGATNELYFRRVTDPANAAQWSTWTWLDSGSSGGIRGGVQVACQSDPVSGQVRVYYVGLAGTSAWGRRSDDFGATWAAREEAYRDPALKPMVALACEASSTVPRFVVAVDPGGIDPDDYLVVVRQGGGVWSWVADAVNKYSGARGLAAALDGSTLVIVVNDVGDGSLRYGLYSTATDAFVSAGSYLLPGSGTGYSYAHPRISPPVAGVPRWFFTYVENSMLGVRVYLTCTSDKVWIGEGVPLNSVAGYGLKLLFVGGYWWLIGCSYAGKSVAYAGGSGEVTEVTGSVKAVEMAEDMRMRGSKLVVRLDNASGRFGSAGQVGSYRALREGSRVALGLGYRTGAGEEYVWVAPWWIEGIAFEDARGEGTLELVCVDGWEWLDRIRVRQPVLFAGAKLQEVLRRAVAPVCDIGAVYMHDNLEFTAPTFTWLPGETYGEVARRVLRMAGLGMRFRTVAVGGYGWDSVGVQLWEYGRSGTPGVGEVPYAFGGASHPIKRGRYATAAQVYDGFFVKGTANEAQDWDWAHIGLVGRMSMLRVWDKHLDTAQKCQARSNAEWDLARTASVVGELEVWAAVGVEIGDTVCVTDARAGLAAADRRVAGLRTVLDRGRGVFEQKIALVGV